MYGLITNRKHFELFTTGQDCLRYFNTCKTARTVELTAEKVLRDNMYEVNLATWEIALESAHDMEHPEIVCLFVRAASQKWLELKLK